MMILPDQSLLRMESSPMLFLHVAQRTAIPEQMLFQCKLEKQYRIMTMAESLDIDTVAGMMTGNKALKMQKLLAIGFSLFRTKPMHPLCDLSIVLLLISSN